MNKIKQSLKEIVAFLQLQFQKYKMEQQQQQQIRLKQQQQQQIKEIMYGMTKDLYYAFHNNRYANLSRVLHPTNIRLYNYKITDKGTLYLFQISKESPDVTIASILLDEIKDNMNRDIVATQQDLIFHYGWEYVQMFYPFLWNGIYVMSVQDLGGSGVIIAVGTNVIP